MRRVAALLVALAAGCGSKGSSGPWLTDPGVSGHGKFFPLAGTPHDPNASGTTVSCNACHPGNTFAEFDCATCHTEAATVPLHAGVAGYTHTSAACLQCHPDGTTAAPADHDTSFFPRGTGTVHAAVTCTQCHTNLLDPTVPANFACQSCHAGLTGFSTAHTAVTGVTATTPSAQCLVCHGDSQVNRVADHTQFPVAGGSTTHDTVCLQCHTSLRADKPFAADFAGYDCTACHLKPATDSGHTGVTGYVYASPSCYGCHPTGTSAPANHDAAFFPISAGTKHAGIACTACHTDLTHPTDPASFACASCHAGMASFSGKHDPINGVNILTVRANPNCNTTIAVPLTSANCLRCHADSQVDRVASHPGGESAFGTGQHQGAGCLTCHVAMRTDKPFGTDFNKSGASQGSAGCATCHANGCGGGG